MNNQLLTSQQSGTAALAKAILASMAISASSATASPLPDFSTAIHPPTKKGFSTTNSSLDGGYPIGFEVSPTRSSVGLVKADPSAAQADRETTDTEKLIGEIRRWSLLSANWDGEGAAQPSAEAMHEATAFMRLLPEDQALPEAMLHANGRTGLFWKSEKLYADIEFIGDGRIAYFIERQGDRHKGVLNFDENAMPSVFPILLSQ